MQETNMLNSNLFIKAVSCTAFLLILNCIYYTTIQPPAQPSSGSYAETHLKTVEQPVCTTSYTDSALQVFLSEPGRSRSSVLTKVSRHEAEINDFFRNYDTLFKKYDSISLSLYLRPEGKFYIIPSYKNVMLDSLLALQLTGMFNSFDFDSIPNYPLSVQINLTVRKNGTQQISTAVRDSIEYSIPRSKASIMQVVMINLAHLRYAYNWRLRQKPGIKGKITFKFAINEHGDVIYSKAISSTVNDPVLEKDIEILISRWKFCPFYKLGDVTEVVYPFIFSQ